MRIFVSSSFEDLREHRDAAIRVLRQLGHEVLAMEDMISVSAAPLAKVLEMVDRSEAYVGIFAWRYGYIPTQVDEPHPPAAINIPTVKNAVYGETSITHYEYLRALQRGIPVMPFLLDEHFPWPPQFIDGFDRTRTQAPVNADKICALRRSLQQERIVSWFTTPSDLEARVSAAVTMAGITSQLDLQTAMALPAKTGVPGDSSAEIGIKQAIIDAGDHQHALKIDLSTTWWSTRLYLIATLAHRLTQVHRILVVNTKLVTKPVIAGVPKSNPSQIAEERFIGQLSTNAIISTIGQKLPVIQKFEKWLRIRPVNFSELSTEIGDILIGWRNAFNDNLGKHTNEEKAKLNLTPELMRRWFGDAMLQQTIHISDLKRASVVDVLRLLDYPNDYVPVFTCHKPATEGQPAKESVDVIDKSALNARLAHNYLIELLDRAHIA